MKKITLHIKCSTLKIFTISSNTMELLPLHFWGIIKETSQNSIPTMRTTSIIISNQQIERQESPKIPDPSTLSPASNSLQQSALPRAQDNQFNHQRGPESAGFWWKFSISIRGGGVGINIQPQYLPVNFAPRAGSRQHAAPWYMQFAALRAPHNDALSYSRAAGWRWPQPQAHERAWRKSLSSERGNSASFVAPRARCRARFA